jgi:cell fate regulator YaaT (PSP1 superfamily)
MDDNSKITNQDIDLNENLKEALEIPEDENEIEQEVDQKRKREKKYKPTQEYNCNFIYVKLEYNKLVELYTFPKTLNLTRNKFYIVETKHGKEIGEIHTRAIDLNNLEVPDPIYSIIRPATWEDLEIQQANRAKVHNTCSITKKKIQKHNLPIKLISIHHFYEGNKILFNFSAEGRVDFRELVKDLAATFKTRIELRQIGVRDESMVLGGYGVCGNPLCCSTLYTNTESVSIKMAKEQNLTLNSMKISGICGRLMCCLQYEYTMYQEIKKEFPEIGKEIHINGNLYKVKGINIQTENITMETTDQRIININLSEYKKARKRNGKLELRINI